jgi:hypothetical protein
MIRIGANNILMRENVISTRANDVLTRAHNVPTHGNVIPTRRNDIPIRQNDIPIHRNDIPTQRNDISARRNDIPTGGNVVPTRENRILGRGNVVAHDSGERVSSNVNRISAKWWKPEVGRAADATHYHVTPFGKARCENHSRAPNRSCNKRRKKVVDTHTWSWILSIAPNGSSPNNAIKLSGFTPRIFQRPTKRRAENRAASETTCARRRGLPSARAACARRASPSRRTRVGRGRVSVNAVSFTSVSFSLLLIPGAG